MEISVKPHPACRPDGSQVHAGLYSIFVERWHRGHVWLTGDNHIYVYQRYGEEVSEAIAAEVTRVLGSRFPVVQPPDLSGITDKWNGVLPVTDDEGMLYENGE